MEEVHRVQGVGRPGVDIGSASSASTLSVIGAWRSLVAHLLWEQGVPSSNLGAPINKPLHNLRVCDT